VRGMRLVDDVMSRAGIFGLSWFAAWWFFSSESPGTHKTISNEERQYIDSSLSLSTSNVANKVQLSFMLYFHAFICCCISAVRFKEYHCHSAIIQFHFYGRTLWMQVLNIFIILQLSSYSCHLQTRQITICLR